MTPFHQENSRGLRGGAHPAGAWQSPWGPRASGRVAQQPHSAWPAGPRGFGLDLSLGSRRGLENGFSHMAQTTKEHSRYTGLYPNSKPLYFKEHRQESENIGNFLGVRWLGLGAFRCQGLGSAPAR